MIAPLRSCPPSVPFRRLSPLGQAAQGPGLPRAQGYALERWAYWGVSAPSPEANRKFHFWRRRVQALSWRLALDMLSPFPKEPTE
jgi:hypothetical protein